jgi:peptide/nickel transport system ATP-binding protein
MSSKSPLLELRGLEKHFEQRRSFKEIALRKNKPPVQAVDGVSFELNENESKAIIGESGCGKSTLLKTLMGLHDYTGGRLFYKGRDTGGFVDSDWKEFRRNVQMIFQDPFNSLDPKKTVRSTLKQPLNVHNIDNKTERIYDVLEEVELNPPEKYLDRFPGQLSGGERQRVSIARALVLDPDVILADEPVSMLDVSTQAAILQKLKNLIKKKGISMLYISHDVSTVSYVADIIKVMYLGRIVESAPTETLLSEPKHPYSQALVSSIPVPDPTHEREHPKVKGSPRDPIDIGEGCRFRDRCPEEMDICGKTPQYVEAEEGHQVACHLCYDHEAQTNDQQEEEVQL